MFGLVAQISFVFDGGNLHCWSAVYCLRDVTDLDEESYLHSASFPNFEHIN